MDNLAVPGVFRDVMVDIETTGNNNMERQAIIQIAAVKFDYETGQVSDEFFDRCLAIPAGREWDGETRQWWTKQGAVLSTIQARMEDPAVVMKDFYEWLLKDYPRRKEGLQFWSKPTHFDFNFLASYFRWYGYDNPCGFRYARDLNSFMAGLSGDRGYPAFADEIPFEGPKHNAIFDVLHQIKMLLAAKDRFPKCEVLPPEELAA